MAPIPMETGSNCWWLLPLRSLPMCGTTSPIQPIMPAMATVEAVINVAQTISPSRNRETLIPSDRASSSDRVSRFMRQRSSNSGISPAKISGAENHRSCSVIVDKPPSSQKVIDGSWVYGSASVLMSEIPAPHTVPSAIPTSTSVNTGS